VANHTPKPRRQQAKIVMRLCNELLEGSGLVVRDWQRDSILEPLPLHRRFTLETTDGDDWDEIPDIYALHAELEAKQAKNAKTT